MLQPFELLQKQFIPKFKQMKLVYLVSQYYRRGYNYFADVKSTPVVMTTYDNLGLAKTHLNAVKEDKYAAIIDLTNPEHEQKVLDMITGAQYAIYWSVVKSTTELERRINGKYKDNMRRYIEKHTNWKISRDATVNPKIQLVFGELYLTLKFRSQEIRVKFEEIERT